MCRLLQLRILPAVIALLIVVVATAFEPEQAAVAEHGGVADAERCDPAAQGCHVVTSLDGNASGEPGPCDDVGPEARCNLNEAIWAANADPSSITSKIHFNIEGCGASRQCTIFPSESYVGIGFAPHGEPLKDNVEVDGATQNCSSWPCITLSGDRRSSGSENWGLKIFSSGITIKNMGFRDFNTNGRGFAVIIYGREPFNPNLVQTNNRVEGNLFEDNEQAIRGGLECSGGTLKDSVIAHNVIRRSDQGIYIDVGYRASSRLTGYIIEDNLIDSSKTSGIQLVVLDSGRIDYNTIRNNTVQNPAKSYKGSKPPVGIILSASDDNTYSNPSCNQDDPGESSIVELNTVEGNIVKRFADDGIQLKASGSLTFMRKNIVSDNTVSGNAKNGIHLLRFTGGGVQAPEGSDQNSFARNSTSANGWLGINLGEASYVGGRDSTPGCLDGSSGTGNQLVNRNIPCPKITKTSLSNGKCKVQGTFGKRVGVTIEIFRAKPGTGDKPGQTPKPHGEPQKFLVSISDPGGGAWTAFIPLQSTRVNLTATASTNQDGTSEQSQNLQLSSSCVR